MPNDLTDEQLHTLADAESVAREARVSCEVEQALPAFEGDLRSRLIELGRSYMAGNPKWPVGFNWYPHACGCMGKERVTDYGCRCEMDMLVHAYRYDIALAIRAEATA